VVCASYFERSRLRLPGLFAPRQAGLGYQTTQQFHADIGYPTWDMNNLETSKNKVGGTIDSWCGKCKLVLAHTIEALVGDRPARVHCNTCNAQHTYKAQPPNTTSASSEPRGKTRASRYQILLRGKDTALAKAYRSSERFAPGDLMRHAVFGFGVATAVKDGTKVEVLFEGGSKMLIHDTPDKTLQ